MKKLILLFSLLVSLSAFSMSHFERQLSSMKIDDRMVDSILEDATSNESLTPMVPLNTGKEVMVMLAQFSEKHDVKGIVLHTYKNGILTSAKRYKPYKNCRFKQKLPGTPATVYINTCNRNFRIKVKSFFGTHLDVPAKISNAHTGEYIVLSGDGSKLDDIIYSVRVQGSSGVALLGAFDTDLDLLRERSVKPKSLEQTDIY